MTQRSATIPYFGPILAMPERTRDEVYNESGILPIMKALRNKWNMDNAFRRNWREISTEIDCPETLH